MRMRSSEAAQKMAAARFSIAGFCCCSLQCCVHSPVQLCLLETVDTCSAIHCCIRSTACCVGSCLQRACKHGMYAYAAVPRPTDTSYALCAHGTGLVSQASCSRGGKHSAGSQKNICQAISRPSSTACDEGWWVRLRAQHACGSCRTYRCAFEQQQQLPTAQNVQPRLCLSLYPGGRQHASCCVLAVDYSQHCRLDMASVRVL